MLLCFCTFSYIELSTQKSPPPQALYSALTSVARFSLGLVTIGSLSRSLNTDLGASHTPTPPPAVLITLGMPLREPAHALKFHRRLFMVGAVLGTEAKGD